MAITITTTALDGIVNDAIKNTTGNLDASKLAFGINSLTGYEKTARDMLHAFGSSKAYMSFINSTPNGFALTYNDRVQALSIYTAAIFCILKGFERMCENKVTKDIHACGETFTLSFDSKAKFNLTYGRVSNTVGITVTGKPQKTNSKWTECEATIRVTIDNWKSVGAEEHDSTNPNASALASQSDELKHVGLTFFSNVFAANHSTGKDESFMSPVYLADLGELSDYLNQYIFR